MTFTGFNQEALALLATLPGLDAAGFAAHRTQLAAGISKPGAALIEAVAARIDADLTVVPRSSVSPLHRDLRFAAPGAARYKDHLLLTTWEGADKKTSPTLWIRIDAKSAGFASGIGFTPDTRERWRAAVACPRGELLAQAIQDVERSPGARDVEVAAEQLKSVPSPWKADHPRAELLRRSGFQLRFQEPLPPDVGAPSFSDWCVERLARLLPVHRWLVTELASR